MSWSINPAPGWPCSRWQDRSCIQSTSCRVQVSVYEPFVRSLAAAMRLLTLVFCLPCAVAEDLCESQPDVAAWVHHCDVRQEQIGFSLLVRRYRFTRNFPPAETSWAPVRGCSHWCQLAW